MPRHLFLIGLPGAGKTTTGRLVAARLETLAAERARWYGKAHATVDVSHQTAEAAAEAVLSLARTQGGWS